MPATTDTPAANIALMHEALAALGRKDLDTCVGLLTPNFIINLAGMPYAKHGPQTWRTGAEVLFSAFPDIQLEVEDMFASEDKVAVRLRLFGTHTGEFLGTPPTGKRIAYLSHEVYRIANGKIAEEWICSDMLTLLTQIGAIPATQLMVMWLAGFRVWFAAGLGLAAGMLVVRLGQGIRSRAGRAHGCSARRARRLATGPRDGRP